MDVQFLPSNGDSVETMKGSIFVGLSGSVHPKVAQKRTCLVTNN